MVAGVDSFPLPSVLRGWLYAFLGFKAPGMVLGAGSCSYYQALGVLQHGGRRTLPDFRLRELPKMTMETLPGVCVNTLCTGGVSCKKQGCTVCLFNTVSLSQKKNLGDVWDFVPLLPADLDTYISSP
ncbi:hypothetical protein PVAP13_5KG491107 [Panicum virgatum]|uniref:Uncharacterized protein n=1 Tax=Panicum virgatum TaxID=38727 RepID=A0A8T0SVD1_PANVG|nr:hypothetical protein PVAP13_5KG491107 [Panicum virgatum]